MNKNLICKICSEEKPTSEFYKNSNGYYVHQCRSCIISKGVKKRRNLRIERKQNNLCVDCGVTLKKNNITRCDSCREKKNIRNARYRKNHPENAKEYHKKLKMEVFNAYGGAKCACCGECHIEFLSIDHIYNNGAEHRKIIFGDKRNGANLYRWLKRNNFPEGYQVLCMNCNFAKGHFGYCPHQKERSEVLKCELII